MLEGICLAKEQELRKNYVVKAIKHKNMKQAIIILVLAIIALSCADKKPKVTALGKKVYKTNCVVCHGIDGKLGANGSKDLTKSAMTMDERKAIIKNGKGAMIGLGTLLKPEEIDAVAEYTFTLN